MKESSHIRRSYGMSSRTLSSVTNVRLVIKLTDDSTLCVHDQISVDNMSCVAIGGKPATVRDCVRQAFRLCKREKLNNIPPTMTSGMEDLLQCPGTYVEESMQELDCDHSMLVDAVCTGQGGTLTIGRLVIDLGTHTSRQGSRDSTGTGSCEASLGASRGLIKTNIPILYAVVVAGNLTFSLEGFVIEHGQDAVNILSLPDPTRCIHFPNDETYKKNLNRSLVKPDLSMLLSHYDRRSAQWSRHTQFLADTEIDTRAGPAVEQFRKHTPHFTVYVTRSDAKTCASIFMA